MKMNTQASPGSTRMPLHDDSGAVAVIAALMSVVLIGVAALVIDVGSLYAERRTLQTAADSAALAAVQELPADTIEARRIAAAYVAANAPEASGVTITFAKTFVDNDTVRVEIDTSDAPLFFARIWGDTTATVGAVSAASITSPIAYGRGVMPFGIMARDTTSAALHWGLPADELIQIKYSGGQGSTGNYGMVSLEDGANWGANDFKGPIAGGGSPYPIYLDHVYETGPGNQSPLDECLNGDPKKYASWIADDLHHYSDVCSEPDPETGLVSVRLAPGDVDRCHRLILMPVIVSDSNSPYLWPGGRKLVRVVGFAEFFVPPDSDLPGGAKPKDELWGYMVQTVNVDELVGGAVGSSGQVHFSLVQ